jgi:hypothetical protein
MGEAKSGPGPFNRRSFIKASASVAAGAAAVAAPAAIAADRVSGTAPPKVIQPSSGLPKEPVTAYIRDAAKGEVTVMSGTRETTYRDRALVDRLLAAAEPHGSRVAGRSR